MKKHYKHFAVLGTLCCVAALVILWMAVLTLDWVSIQEPQVDQVELDKLGPYEEPKPHLIRAKFGLFKMCLQQFNGVHYGSSGNGGGGGTGQLQLQLRNTGSGSNGSPIECHDLDWYNFGVINFDSSRKPPPMPTELIANCVEKLRFTLPFIGLSVLFTSIAFLCLTFGHFCQKNKKIIEASMLILGGLCQATALLTFVAQIGSEFEANLPFSHHQSRLTTFYRYKYGYSFYLFLLSFGLSELGAFFDMLAYFRKYPPSHYVITFHRQEPSPFLGSSPSPTMEHPHDSHGTLNHHSTVNSLNRASNHANHQGSNYHHHHQLHHHHLPPLSPQQYHHHMEHYHHAGTLTKYQHLHHGGPDLCNPSAEHVDLTVTRVMGGEDTGIPPPQSYINPEVTITTIERGAGGYGTIKSRTPATATMESFGTLRKENNV